MSGTAYYVKKVRRNDKGQITRVKTSKKLESKPDKEFKRKKVLKHVRKGKDVRTAFLKDGRWTKGDKLKLHNDKWLRTEGNTQKRDNLGSLRSF